MKSTAMKLSALLSLAVLLLTGCYWNDDVKRDQYGVKMRIWHGVR